MSVRANQKFTSDLFIASRHAEVTENRINGKIWIIGYWIEIPKFHKTQNAD